MRQLFEFEEIMVNVRRLFSCFLFLQYAVTVAVYEVNQQSQYGPAAKEDERMGDNSEKMKAQQMNPRSDDIARRGDGIRAGLSG